MVARAGHGDPPDRKDEGAALGFARFGLCAMALGAVIVKGSRRVGA
jgi:hypothetical protein